MTVGGVTNGAAKEDGRWDLNLGPAAIEEEDHKVLGEKRGDHAALKREETTRLQRKWRGDHAALKERVDPRGSEASR